MQKLGRLITSLILLGNLLLLTALSVHVVRAPGKYAVVAKEHLTLVETYRDISNWTAADVQAHPGLVARLTDAHRLDLIGHIPMAQASAAPYTSLPLTPTPGYQAANPPIVPGLEIPSAIATPEKQPAPRPVNPLVKPTAAAAKTPVKDPSENDATNKSIFDFGR